MAVAESTRSFALNACHSRPFEVRRSFQLELASTLPTVLSMHIAGGLYLESCELPAWKAQFGSGGRAAAAVSALSPSTVLHTYSPSSSGAGISHLRGLGVDVRLSNSATNVAFAYFHPLSDPRIQPARERLGREDPLLVTGEIVLRFSFLEGDAVVSAGRAVYDPQISGIHQPFAANGSRARELALVLNECELRAMARLDDLPQAASLVMREQGAVVVVVKCGARGAIICELDNTHSYIPAYRSDRVFKIGTGDVFSGIFAHYWGEAGCHAAEAADHASRAVAAYCEDRRLPVFAGAGRAFTPAGTSTPGAVVLHGRADTLGRRYVIEEAKYVLTRLGATVVCPALADSPHPEPQCRAVLILVDSMSEFVPASVRAANARGLPVVVLTEESLDPRVELPFASGVRVTDDFTTALYWTIWDTMAG